MISAKRHTLIASSYLLLIREDEVLMSRRFNTGYEDGRYSLPAGHVEMGETFTQTVIREAKEEIGIILKPEDVFVAHVMHRKSFGETNERIDVFFIARTWEGEPENLEPQKCDHIQWFSSSDLPIKIIPCVKQAIECSLGGVFYSEFGWK